MMFLPDYRVIVYSSKRYFYCRYVLKSVQRTSYGCDVCRVSLCYYRGSSIY